MAREYYFFTTAGVDTERIADEVRAVDRDAGVRVLDEPDLDGYGEYTTLVVCFGNADPTEVAAHLRSRMGIEVFTQTQLDRKLDGPAIAKTG